MSLENDALDVRYFARFEANRIRNQIREMERQLAIYEAMERLAESYVLHSDSRKPPPYRTGDVNAFK